jgi:UDP-N-acetylmuramoyl-tripeptide--D-alanyl-D-alanine ligase
MSGDKPGALARLMRVVRPTVGVVTNVGYDHYRSFRGLDATAREKATLVRGLPAGGLAVLNADDPRVRAMAQHSVAPVMTYGMAPDADLRFADLHSGWPERLSLSLEYRGQVTRAATRLLGEHWAHAVAAAAAVGVAQGVPLAECAARLAAMEPPRGRLSVHTLPGGITFLDDGKKAPLWTVPLSLDVIAKAQAVRKVVVFGTISDYPGNRSPRIRKIVQDALACADLVIVFGLNAVSARKEVERPDGDRLRLCETVEAVGALLRRELREGDLVLLKGSGKVDHLERLYLQFDPGVACWREGCRRALRCGHCRYLTVPATAAAPSRPASRRHDGLWHIGRCQAELPAIRRSRRSAGRTV